MWRYNNIVFKYSNPVDSSFGETYTIPYILTYIKSKYALMQALRLYVNDSYLGSYTEIDPKSVKFDKPQKI